MGIADRFRSLFAGNQSAPQADPLQFAAGRANLTKEQALAMLSGALFEIGDPDEVLRKAGKSRRDLRTLETDDEISSHLETRFSTVIAEPWRLDQTAGPLAEFVWEQVDRWFEEIVTAAWQAVPYGYSVAEIVWTREAGRMVPAKIDEKPFEWFSPRRDGLYYHDGMTVAGNGAGGTLVDTSAKFMLTRRRPTYRNPRGEALLSRVYWPWFFRSNGWKFWAKFLERSAGPMLVGYTRGAKAEMADALAAAVQSAVLAVGAEDKVESIAPANVGAAFEKFSEAVDRRIAKVILGQTLTSDVSRGGSFAAAKVHAGVMRDRTLADIRIVRRSLQWFVDALVSVNANTFGNTPAPRISFDTDSDLGVERAERDAKLATAGAVEFTEAYFLRAYDFEPGDFRIPARPASGGGVRASLPGPAPLLFAGRQQMTPQQRAVEDLGDAAIDEAGDAIDPAEIGRAIQAASGPADLAERLAKLIDPAKVRPEFLQTVERAIFAADVLGYVHAAQDAGIDAGEGGGNG